MCDRVAILHRGRLVRLGRTTDLLESRERTEIVARGIRPGEFEATAAGDDHDWHMTVPTSSVRATVERIWAGGGEVVRLNPVRRSLEEIFVELTGNNGASTAATGQKESAP